VFEKLEKVTCSQLIIDRIKQLIVERSLEPGDRLPSERELAEEFGVSRASIREAITALCALGLLRSRTGTGTYVRRNLSDSVLEPLSWAVPLAEHTGQDLVEMRKIIEPSIAALAAERATASDKEKLLQTINAMRENVGDPFAVAEADLEFHMALAEAASNQILKEIMNGLHRLLRNLIISRVLAIENQKMCLREHIEIYEAVIAGDADKARKTMLGSLDKDPLFQIYEPSEVPDLVEGRGI
jgi:GntR family transcriptional repressor for pyruvate dehydrogenase complex